MPKMNLRLLVSRCADRSRHLSALAALLTLAACNTPPALTGPAPAASSAKANTALASPAAAAASRASASASAVPPTPGQPPAFALVIKGARKIDGLFTVWQKDE